MNSIKVYGSGCSNCIKLEQMSHEAVKELGLEFSIEKVMDFESIAKRGILRTPGLEINGKIVSTGKIPTKSTLLHWIQENSNA